MVLTLKNTIIADKFINSKINDLLNDFIVEFGFYTKNLKFVKILKDNKKIGYLVIYFNNKIYAMYPFHYYYLLLNDLHLLINKYGIDNGYYLSH